MRQPCYKVHGTSRWMPNGPKATRDWRGQSLSSPSGRRDVYPFYYRRVLTLRPRCWV